MLYTIYIGTEQTKDGAPIADCTAKLDVVRLKIALAFGGYSESSVQSAWYDTERQTLVVERSVRFEIISDLPPVVVEQLAAEVRDLMSQSSVLVVGAPVTSKFV